MCKMLDKFLLLMWKNCLLQYRRPLQTLLEVTVPILFTTLLVIIRILVEPKQHDIIGYQPFCTMPADFFFRHMICTEYVGENDFNEFFGSIYYKALVLVYSPKSEALKNVMALFKDIFEDVIVLDNSDMLEQYFEKNDTVLTFAGIQFDNSFKDLKDISAVNKYNISIRFPGETRNFLDPGYDNWKTNLIYPSFHTLGPRQFNLSTGAAPTYYGEGFLALQHLLTIGLMTARKKAADYIDFLEKDSPPTISMRRYPHSEWIEDPLLGTFQYMLSLIILFSFIYPSINIVRSITTEREKQLKEYMKIMGLPNWLHWTAWFAKCFLFLQVSVMLIVALLKFSPNSTTTVLPHSDPCVLVLFLTLYVCANISFCFALSVMFNKANSAAAISGLIWFISFVPYMFMQGIYDHVGLPVKLLICLLSNSAMGMGFGTILMLEGVDKGIHWKNLFIPNSPEGSPTLGIIMVLLVVDTAIYLMIAIYVEAVFPGQYGVPKPWYFLFNTYYWSWKSDAKQEDSVNITKMKINGQEFYEAKLSDSTVGVQINHLQKVFNNTYAVKDFSLNLFENKITVLLGHNGAGKSTIVSMLTGLIRPTSGTAMVNGLDIRTDMDSIRQSLGFCPQYNIIFDDLTVEEHLYLSTKLKGLSKRDIQTEIDKYICLLNLEDKRYSKSSILSGGMKRKLCVGMALCANSKIVVLDEPTSGMDPTARRALWKLLQEQKRGRTVLLTTHFMNEADYLGDQVAIMAEGTLKCSGSSFSLKKMYGTGYSLVLEKARDCNASLVTRLLRKYIPDIGIYNNVHSELIYRLSEKDIAMFEGMLKDLENNCKELGVLSYGICTTTLEEVFMRVGSTQVADKQKQCGTGKSYGQPRYSSGLKLWNSQFRAMLMKKALATYRSWILLLIQVIIPVILVVTAVVMTKGNNRVLPPLAMDLHQFLNPVVLVKDHTTVKYADTYLSVLKSQDGEVEVTNNITNRILELTSSIPLKVSMSYIGGAIFDSTENQDHVTVWFNNDPYHSPGVSLALALNAIFKKVLDCQECSIQFTNHPIKYTPRTKMQKLLSENSLGFQLALDLGLAMAFVSSFYILFVVKENVSKSKHLQFVSGVNVFIFWISSAVWDTFTFFLTSVAITVTLMGLQEDGYTTFAELGRFFLILWLFGWSFLPMTYIAGRFFHIPSSGYIKVTIFACFTGIGGFLMVQILSIEALKVQHVADILHWIFLISPHYTFMSAVMNSYTFFARKKVCSLCKDRYCSPEMIKKMCRRVDESFYMWEKPGIGRNLVSLSIIGLVLYLILFHLEYKLCSKLFGGETEGIVSQPSEDTTKEEDSDVIKEKQRIRNLSKQEIGDNYTLVIKNLTKYYKNFLAVNSLCIGLENLECFGLLGVNGAGKSTTFKMITGGCSMSSGDCWVKGFSVRRQLSKVYKYIGFCPQFDALLDDMTVRETIIMYSLLRGVHSDKSEQFVDNLAHDFDLSAYLNKKVKVLSGGSKRKLSTAIAVIGDPQVIYLDEPSTGMDPASKRFLWNALCKIRDNGKCVVLTTHSMEECEALCTRLAIMVNGEFKCLGSPQHLKNKFANGYNLTVKLKKEGDGPKSEIKKNINDEFSGAQLVEDHGKLLHYLIETESRPWSEMFGVLEGIKRSNSCVEDYFLGQNNLEQVFLAFTELKK